MLTYSLFLLPSVSFMIYCCLSHCPDVNMNPVNLHMFIKPRGIFFFYLNFNACLNFVCYLMMMVIKRIV